MAELMRSSWCTDVGKPSFNRRIASSTIAARVICEQILSLPPNLLQPLSVEHGSLNIASEIKGELTSKEFTSFNIGPIHFEHKNNQIYSPYTVPNQILGVLSYWEKKHNESLSLFDSFEFCFTKGEEWKIVNIHVHNFFFHYLNVKCDNISDQIQPLLTSKGTLKASINTFYQANGSFLFLVPEENIGLNTALPSYHVERFECAIKGESFCTKCKKAQPVREERGRVVTNLKCTVCGCFVRWKYLGNHENSLKRHKSDTNVATTTITTTTTTTNPPSTPPTSACSLLDDPSALLKNTTLMIKINCAATRDFRDKCCLTSNGLVYELEEKKLYMKLVVAGSGGDIPDNYYIPALQCTVPTKVVRVDGFIRPLACDGVSRRPCSGGHTIAATPSCGDDWGSLTELSNYAQGALGGMLSFEDKNYGVSAAHAVSKHGSLELVFQPAKPKKSNILGKVIGHHPYAIYGSKKDADLADPDLHDFAWIAGKFRHQITTDNKGNPLKPVGIRDPEVGEDVYYWKDMKKVKARVTATNFVVSREEFTQTWSRWLSHELQRTGGVMAEPGDSGSLVVASADHTIIGMLISGVQSSQTLYCSLIPPNWEVPI